MADCKVVKCQNCGEPYCAECDFTPQYQEVAHMKPHLCGPCMESSSFFFENMRRRYQNEPTGI